MSYTLGVDIGTFETKGVLVDPDGTIVAEARRKHEMLVPQPGWAEHRPLEDWWGDLVFVTQTILRESRVAPDAIKCVALSAIGPCMLPVDADGRPLMNGVLYGVDTRSAKEVEDLTTELGADAILALGGNPLTSQSVGPKILWLKRNRPEIFAQTRTFHTSTSFLVEQLTGEVVMDHYTAANLSPLYDIRGRHYTDRSAPDIVELDRLPRPDWSTEIAGTVSAAAAGETGLAVGTPVTVGTIDAASEAVSVGVRHTGDMMMMYGSTIFIILLTPTQVTDDRLWAAPWLFPGETASMAGLATSGTLTQWFRENFAPDLPRETVFQTLSEEASLSPKGANGLLCLPYFSGERTPIHDPMAKGSFFGLNLTHGRGDLYRALLEGVASGTAHVADTFRDLDSAPSRVLAVGGGTKNRVWLEATSDLCRLPQIVNEKTVGASYGNAFLAALAIGTVERDDIDRWNPAAETVEPTQVAAYERQYPLFLRLYRQTKDIMAALG